MISDEFSIDLSDHGQIRRLQMVSGDGTAVLGHDEGEWSIQEITYSLEEFMKMTDSDQVSRTVFYNIAIST